MAQTESERACAISHKRYFLLYGNTKCFCATLQIGMATKSRASRKTRTLDISKRQDRRLELVRARLVGLRKSRHMTDATWARAARYPEQEVRRFSTGRMRFPSLDMIEALAGVFGLTLIAVLEKDMKENTGLTNVQREWLEILAKLGDDGATSALHFLRGVVRRGAD
jgi:hypothetical protein